MKRRTVTPEDMQRIRVAVNYLKDARGALRRAGARSASRYVARAIKSAEGAARHADNIWHRQEAGQ